MTELIVALRPKHWIKNFFIFLPLIFGSKLFSFHESLQTSVAFFIFSTSSSSVYLVNDVLDIESDRRHPVKLSRPIASGKVTVTAALVTAFILGTSSVLFSFLLNVRLGWIVAFYLLLNLLYSRFLKHRVIIDVGCIALFFLLRVAAGSAVAGVQLSHWVLFMSGLVALFLGTNKRRQELQVLEISAPSRKVLLRYDAYFIDQMIGVITASIVVVYMLYTVDQDTIRRFGSTHLIFTIPFVYYGIFRYLYLVHKLRLAGDPTAVILSDIRMQVNLLLWVMVSVAVVYFGL